MPETSTPLAPMADRLVRPDWVRRVNLMAGSVGGHARDLVPLDAADMLDTAAVALGGLPAGDLGDPRWQERFEALVAAIDAAGMHTVGRLMTKQELLRSLRTRLLLTATIDASPEVCDPPVTAPVIITGPARSGTTILFELLALDPDLRAPTAAEALHPVALPEAEGEGGLPEPLVLSECEQEFWADVQPEFQALHELRSDLPVECVTITQGSFCGFHWNMIASMDSWLPDPAVNYSYERAVHDRWREAEMAGDHGSGDTYYDLGTFTWPVTTRDPQAQLWFDRGWLGATASTTTRPSSASSGPWSTTPAAYRADLGLDGQLRRARWHPDNVWSVHGLHECLTRRGETVEAGHIKQRLDLAVARADVPIESSCYCRLEPAP